METISNEELMECQRFAGNGPKGLYYFYYIRKKIHSKLTELHSKVFPCMTNQDVPMQLCMPLFAYA